MTPRQSHLAAVLAVTALAVAAYLLVIWLQSVR